ncbi:MAG TPA: DNA alkylation repair protein, partial [Cyclobacteriaceae bacterium]|nr:DNA alkylation repair protein [Cyclobacteriaceae bacterium]
LQKSWWDTVDLIAAKMAGNYFRIYPEQKNKYIKKWRNSKNIWLIRSAILFQLKYKTETDFNLLSDIILQHQDSNEFFIQKAIGWVLREYAYTDAAKVKKLVQTHKLKPLSMREALKHLK